MTKNTSTRRPPGKLMPKFFPNSKIVVGNPSIPASFVASSDIPGLPQDTRVSGVVLDNSNVPIPGAGADLDDQYEQLIKLVESCQHLNQVNGKIAHRSQQSNLALLKVLTGEPHPLYEQHGKSQPVRSNTNPPAVKA